MSDLKTICQQCKDFSKMHLAECCAEIVEWQDTAVLRDGKVRELAALAGGFIDNHDTLQVAESFINRAAIEAATAAPTDARPDDPQSPAAFAVQFAAQSVRDALEQAAKIVMDAPLIRAHGEYPYMDDACKAMALTASNRIRALIQSPQAGKEA